MTRHLNLPRKTLEKAWMKRSPQPNLTNRRMKILPFLPPAKYISDNAYLRLKHSSFEAERIFHYISDRYIHI